MAGRLPKPLGMHVSEGTYRQDRHGPVNDGFTGQPRRPDTLTGDSAELWDTAITDLIRRGIVKAVDAPALELLADIWGKYRAASRLLDATPSDAAARQGVKQFSELFLRLAARFGLTPSDRQRLPPGPVSQVASRPRNQPTPEELEAKYFGR